MDTNERKQRPIIFSSGMVCAIFENRKTQTRRVVKGLPHGIKCVSAIPESGYKYRFTDFSEHVDLRCPYGRPPIPLEPADRLWVREAHFAYGYWRKAKGHWHFHRLTKGVMDNMSVYYVDDPPDELAPNRTARGWHRRPSIFMPRWASRITLEITDIRVEQLQDITGRDAFEEGCNARGADGQLGHAGDHPSYSISEFHQGWNKLNAKRGYSWESNPWVWVVSFKPDTKTA